MLGEGVRDEAETRVVVDAYRELLDRIQAEGLRTNVALKLTHLGLSIDEELARSNLAELVAHAAGVGNFARIDMEESRHVEATLRIYRRLREEGHDNLGAVLQAYLFRSEADLTALLPLAPNLRLVKGAYLEPPEVAYPKKSDVDAAYVRLLEASLYGRRLHRGRDARRGADRACDLVRARTRIPNEPLPVSDAVRHPAAAAARPRPARLRRARRRSVRARVVPLSHAAACGTAGEPALSPPESRATLSTRTAASATSARSRASRYHDHGAAWSVASDQ